MTKAIGNKLFAAATGALLLLSLSSCGYSMANRNRQFVGGYKLVTVPIFKNRSHDPKIEIYFTNAFKEELFRAKVAEVTAEKVAPVTLKGVINSVRYIPTSQVNNATIAQLPDKAVLTSSYTVRVHVTLKVERNADKKVIWRHDFNGVRGYTAPRLGTEEINSVNALYNHSARLQTIQLMAKSMMKEAYNQMTENFRHAFVG